MVKGKGKGKTQKVVTIIKAKGEPDEVKVQQTGQQEQPKPERYVRRVLTNSTLRVTPKIPRLR